MLIKNYLSSKAYLRYEQILKELNKPIKFFICSINEIKAYGLVVILVTYTKFGLQVKLNHKMRLIIIFCMNAYI